MAKSKSKKDLMNVSGISDMRETVASKRKSENENGHTWSMISSGLIGLTGGAFLSSLIFTTVIATFIGGLVGGIFNGISAYESWKKAK